MHPAFIYTCSHLLGNFIKVCLTYLVSLGFQDDLAFAKGNRGKHGSLVTKFCCYECWHYGRWVVFATAHVQCAFCLRNPTFTCFPCRLKCFVSCYFDILIWELWAWCLSLCVVMATVNCIVIADGNALALNCGWVRFFTMLGGLCQTLESAAMHKRMGRPPPSLEWNV